MNAFSAFTGVWLYAWLLLVGVFDQNNIFWPFIYFMEILFISLVRMMLFFCSALFSLQQIAVAVDVALQ